MHLCVDRKPRDSTLHNDRFFSVKARVKTDLVIEQQEVLVLKEFCYLFGGLAHNARRSNSVALKQLYLELHGLIRVVVTVKCQIFSIDTLELIHVRFHYCKTSWKYR